MKPELKWWKAEVEDENHPYKEGIGYILSVLAISRQQAEKKAKQHVADKLPGYKVCVVRLASESEALLLIH